MSDLNSVCLSGRLTRKPDLRFLPNGTALLDLSLASSEVYTQNGERKETPLFVDCVLFGKSAETLNNYLDKGSFVTLQGKLTLDRWEKDGQKFSKIKVTVNQLNLGPKNGNSVSSPKNSDEDKPLDDDTPF